MLCGADLVTGRQTAWEESWFYEYNIKFALGILLSVVANDQWFSCSSSVESNREKQWTAQLHYEWDGHAAGIEMGCPVSLRCHPLRSPTPGSQIGHCSCGSHPFLLIGSVDVVAVCWLEYGMCRPWVLLRWQTLWEGWRSRAGRKAAHHQKEQRQPQGLVWLRGKACLWRFEASLLISA